MRTFLDEPAEVHSHMAWRCPACRTEITHSAFDTRPRVGDVYRCHVCRLELQFDEAKNQMEVTPFDTDKEPPQRPRVLPSTVSTQPRKKL